MQLMFSVQPPKQLPPSLMEGLKYYLQFGQSVQQQRQQQHPPPPPTEEAEADAKEERGAAGTSSAKEEDAVVEEENYDDASTEKAKNKRPHPGWFSSGKEPVARACLTDITSVFSSKIFHRYNSLCCLSVDR